MSFITQQNRYQTSNKTLCDITQHNKTDVKQVKKTVCDITQPNQTDVKQEIKHSAI